MRRAPLFRPVRALSLSPIVAASLALAVALASGCARKAPLRPPTEEERIAFIDRKIEEARTDLTRRPPQAARALEAAFDVLALDPGNFDAQLAVADAYYELRYYPDSLKAVKKAERIEPNSQEVLWRKARTLYSYHTYWTRGNYARARQAAEACLAQGDKYLVECHNIIRNSYLGEDLPNGPSRPAFERAAQAAEELAGKIGPSHPYWGDLHLLMAEYYGAKLGDPSRGDRHLGIAKQAAANDEALGRRVAAYERDRELNQLLAGGDGAAVASANAAR